MVSHCCKDGPKSRDPACFIKKQDVHLTIISLKVVSIVSIQDQPVYTPLIPSALLSLPYSLLQNIL